MYKFRRFGEYINLNNINHWNVVFDLQIPFNLSANGYKFNEKIIMCLLEYINIYYKTEFEILKNIYTEVKCQSDIYESVIVNAKTSKQLLDTWPEIKSDFENCKYIKDTINIKEQKTNINITTLKEAKTKIQKLKEV